MPDVFEDIECEEVDGVYVQVNDRPKLRPKSKSKEKKRVPVKIKPPISRKGVHFVPGEERVTQFVSGFNMIVSIVGRITKCR